MGFRVTGVDYVPALVERAKENAAHRGVTIEGLVQEISFLDMPAGAYDVVWLSRELYSCVPTRLRRVGMVRKIAAALRPGGLFLCMFRWNPELQPHGRGDVLRRLAAICTQGNLAYEAGDSLWQNVEFLHSFSSEDAIRSELEEGDLRIVEILTSSKRVRGSVVCEKPVQDERITNINSVIETSQV
jgi:SAM-dependent methyltransferase